MDHSIALIDLSDLEKQALEMAHQNHIHVHVHTLTINLFFSLTSCWSWKVTVECDSFIKSNLSDAEWPNWMSPKSKLATDTFTTGAYNIIQYTKIQRMSLVQFAPTPGIWIVCYNILLLHGNHCTSSPQLPVWKFSLTMSPTYQSEVKNTVIHLKKKLEI